MATAKNPGVLARFDNLGEIFNVKNAKKAAAWYIDTGENIANDTLDFQAKATKWAKHTALEPIFAAQHEFGKKLVERSAHAARSLWRLD